MVPQSEGLTTHAHTCLLLLTLEHLYVLTTPTPDDHAPDTPTPPSLRALPIKSCRVAATTTTTSPLTSDIVVKLRLSLESREAVGEDPPRVEGEIDRVEWFVRQSNAELKQERNVTGNAKDAVSEGFLGGGSGPAMRGTPLGDPRGRSGSTKEEEGEGRTVGPSPSEQKCLVVHVEPFKGAQLLAVYESLRRSSTHAGSIYVPLKLGTSQAKSDE